YGSVTSSPVLLSVIDPVVTGSPPSQTNNAGATAVFQAGGAGSGPLTYQLIRGGSTPFVGGGKITGAAHPPPTRANVLGADSGHYILIASNSFGAVTTTPPALLSVIDPALLTQPLSRTNHAGSSASFSVQAAGTAPTFQWLNGLTSIAQATNPTLLLP